MAADSYSYNFNRILDGDNAKNTRIGRRQYGLPFTEIQEVLLVGPLLEVQNKYNRKITKSILKERCKQLLRDVNVEWDVEKIFEEWLPEFFKRHPGLSIVDVTVDYKRRLEELLAMKRLTPHLEVPSVPFDVPVKKPRLHDPYASIPDCDIDDYVAALKTVEGSKNKQLIWRKLKKGERLNGMFEMFGNFLFNQLGYACGVILGYSSVDINESFKGTYVTTLRQYNMKLDHDVVYDESRKGCSFVQEMKDGLRIHLEYVFSLNTYADSKDAGDQMKWCCRRELDAFCTLAPMQSETLVTESFTKFLRRKLRSITEKMEVPYDNSTMKNVDYDIRHFLEESHDENESYAAENVYKLYCDESEGNNYVASVSLSNGSFKNYIKKFFPKYDTKYQTQHINCKKTTITLTKNVKPTAKFILPRMD